MPFGPFRTRFLSALLLAYLIAGCAGSPPATRVPFRSEYGVSRDAVLRYRIPIGWFDATADSQATGHAAWLLNNDYAASITVDEVHIEERARSSLKGNDLLQLGRLILPLMERERAALVLQSPELFTVEGKEYCGYEVVNTAERDTICVVLLDTGEKVYTVTLFFSGSKRAWARSDMTMLRDAFLTTLKW